MKKFLLFGIAGILTAGVASAVEPIILPEFYSIAISPGGKWIANDSGTGTMLVYNTEENRMIECGMFSAGSGNCVNDQGIVVGYFGETASVLYNGEVIEAELPECYVYSSFHGITPDGTRICGVVSNPDNQQGYEGCMYLPACFEMSDGHVTAITILPAPQTDLLGKVAQYSSAVWISDDGKVIVGQQIDYSGRYIYPIVYTLDNNNEWSYTLPTASLFNPDGIELPEDPGDFEYSPVEARDYMSEEEYAEWEVAMEAWEASGYMDPYPEYSDFMTEEQSEAYNAAVAEYEQKAQEYNEKFSAYYDALNEILDSSPNFLQNAMTLSADGKTFISTVVEKEVGDYWAMEEFYKNYQFDVASGDFVILPGEIDSKIIASQILKDGVVIGATPVSSLWGGGLPPRTFVYKPGAEDFVSLKDFLAVYNPGVADWMDENLMGKIEVDYDPETWDPIYADVFLTGHGVASYDFSVVSGGLFASYFIDSPYYDYGFFSYVFTDLKNSDPSSLSEVAKDGIIVKALKGGVLLINAETDITIHDLTGRTVYSGKGVSGKVQTGLGSGIYLIEAGDSTFKVAF